MQNDDDDDDDREAVAHEIEALKTILDDAFRIVGRDDDSSEQGGTRVEVRARVFLSSRRSRWPSTSRPSQTRPTHSFSRRRSLSPPPPSPKIDIPDPSGGPASLTLCATLCSSGYPSRVPPAAVQLGAPHLSRADAAAVARSLSLERFVPGAVALFDWVEELRGREELFVVDDGGGGGGDGDAEDERGDGDGDGGEGEESDGGGGGEEGRGRDRPPSPPRLAAFAPPSSSSSPTPPAPGTYTTVAAEHSETYEVKKSTFVATCFPIGSAAEAAARIGARSDPAARHNCWAFVTPAGDDARCSDDGEPGGTAGRPILSSILSAPIVSASIASAGAGGGRAGAAAPPPPPPLRGVAVVVSRWRAGPRLGAPGLARAYAHAARLALSAAPRVEVEELALAAVESVPLSDLGRVLGCLARLGATELAEEEEGGGDEGGGGGEGGESGGCGGPSPRITLSISLPRKELEALRSAVASATSGRAKVVTKM